eukprot:scaffold23468_cov29-Prasinocladus_malaysianus.AAC.1
MKGASSKGIGSFGWPRGGCSTECMSVHNNCAVVPRPQPIATIPVASVLAYASLAIIRFHPRPHMCYSRVLRGLLKP